MCIRDSCIGVDVIVGFPGETEERFLETVAFLDSLDVSYLHVFTYSERENTAAFDMPGVVPVEERRRRNKVLRALSDKKRMKFYQEYLSSTRPVLFEKSKRKNYLTGFTDNYIKVEIPETPHLINQIKEVELTKINPEGNVEVSLPVKVLH